MGSVFIDDTTLRDGEQTAGVVFAKAEKMHIAKVLSEIGVHQIEVGIPTMGGDELESIKAIARMDLPCSIMAWNRPVISDIQASLDCGVDAVAISISASDIHIKTKLGKSREWVLETLKRAIDYAKSHGVYVSVNAEDASRADWEFLLQFALTAKNAGADRMRYCDTLGTLEPFRCFKEISGLIQATGLDMEMHTHNDFGLATATALAGVRAGAKYVNTTVNGLGERAGNAALEEVVMALKHVEGIDTGIDTTRLRELAEYVAQASGRQIPIWKAVIGTNVFAHESGIHADGVIKNPLNYEIFSPEEVGLTRQLVVGKHSGTATLVHKFREFGIELTEAEAQAMLVSVRALAVQLKRALFEKELMYIYQDVKVGMDRAV